MEIEFGERWGQVACGEEIKGLFIRRNEVSTPHSHLLFLSHLLSSLLKASLPPSYGVLAGKQGGPVVGTGVPRLEAASTTMSLSSLSLLLSPSLPSRWLAANGRTGEQ